MTVELGGPMAYRKQKDAPTELLSVFCLVYAVAQISEAHLGSP
jgi:hypothetical protein